MRKGFTEVSAHKSFALKAAAPTVADNWINFLRVILSIRARPISLSMNHERSRAGMRSRRGSGCFSCGAGCLNRGSIARCAIAQKTSRGQQNQYEKGIEFHARLLSNGCARVFSLKEYASWKTFVSASDRSNFHLDHSEIGTVRFRFREERATFNAAERWRFVTTRFQEEPYCG